MTSDELLNEITRIVNQRVRGVGGLADLQKFDRIAGLLRREKAVVDAAKTNAARQKEEPTS